MRIAKRLHRFGRIGFDEEGIRVRQRHREIMQLAFDAADQAVRIAEIYQGMAQRMR